MDWFINAKNKSFFVCMCVHSSICSFTDKLILFVSFLKLVQDTKRRRIDKSFGRKRVALELDLSHTVLRSIAEKTFIVCKFSQYFFIIFFISFCDRRQGKFLLFYLFFFTFHISLMNQVLVLFFLLLFIVC